MDQTSQNMWKELFFRENFTIDEYLSCSQKSDLLTLRSKLKAYGEELYTSMIDILKTETEGIVNLSENLTNLNTKINDLCTPALQLYETIKVLHDVLENSQLTFTDKLNTIKSIQIQSDFLVLQIMMISCCEHICNIIDNQTDESSRDLYILERAVNKFSLQNLYMKQYELKAEKVEKCYKMVLKKLINKLNIVLLEVLSKKDKENIVCCLRMYVNLDEQHEAEQVYRDEIKKQLLPVFSGKNVSTPNLGVNEVYEDILNVLSGDTLVLVNIIKEYPYLKGFNFITNSFWPEVSQHLCENLPHITAPGNPELFQKRFKHTWRFLQQLVLICNDPAVTIDNPSLQAHLKRFNLPVYFEICFQQIATEFETALFVDLSGEDIFKKDGHFHLSVTSSMWKGVEKCFDCDVFLFHLSDQFIKLATLLLMRYLKWFLSLLETLPEEDKNAEKLIVYSLIDLVKVKSVFTNHHDVTSLNNSVFKIIPPLIKPVVLNMLVANRKAIESVYGKVQDFLIKLEMKEALQHLQNVGAIPRLYRRTNRQVPKEASQYVQDAVGVVTIFQKKYPNVLNEEMLAILDLIVSKMGEQYYSLVQEVLHSVCKTENSLRRLKNRNVSSAPDLVSQGSADMSDEEKIRQQIKQDSAYFIQRLEPFSLRGDIFAKLAQQSISEM